MFVSEKKWLLLQNGTLFGMSLPFPVQSGAHTLWFRPRVDGTHGVCHSQCGVRFHSGTLTKRGLTHGQPVGIRTTVLPCDWQAGECLQGPSAAQTWHDGDSHRPFVCQHPGEDWRTASVSCSQERPLSRHQHGLSPERFIVEGTGQTGPLRLSGPDFLQRQ